MAELDFRILRRRLHHIGFMAEGVRNNDVAACFRKVNRRIVASFGFRHAPLDDNLVIRQAQRLHHFLRAFIMRCGVAFVFIANINVANLDLIRRNAFRNRCGRANQRHHQNEHQRNDLLHEICLLRLAPFGIDCILPF